MQNRRTPLPGQRGQGAKRGGTSASPAGGRAAAGGLNDDDRAYLERVAELDRREAAGESITDILLQERGLAALRRHVLDQRLSLGRRDS